MSLDTLSAELLHIICEACSRDSLQELRLTSRKLHAVASKYFLPEVVTCLEREDLQQVTAISQSDERIRDGIKAFVIQADGFDSRAEGVLPTRRRWLQSRAHFMCAYDADGDENARELLLALRQLPKSPHRVKLCNALEFFLAKSFDMLTDREMCRRYHFKHQDFILTHRMLFWNHVGVRAAMDQLFAACPDINSLAVNFKDTFRRNAGLSNANYLRSLPIPHGEDTDTVARVIGHMLKAALRAGLKIQDLAISGAKPFFMYDPPGSAPHDSRKRNIAKYYKVLKYVQKLQLVFNGSDTKPGDVGVDNIHHVRTAFGDKCLVKWLSRCLNLRELRLTMPVAPGSGWTMELVDMLGSLQFSTLAVLHLARFQSSSEELNHCLLRHRDTLEDLVIQDVHLASGTWPECLTAFAGKIPNLRQFKMIGSLEYRDENAMVQPWIIHVTLFLSETIQGQLETAVEEFVLKGSDAEPDWVALGRICAFDETSSGLNEDDLSADDPDTEETEMKRRRLAFIKASHDSANTDELFSDEEEDDSDDDGDFGF